MHRLSSYNLEPFFFYDDLNLIIGNLENKPIGSTIKGKLKLLREKDPLFKFFERYLEKYELDKKWRNGKIIIVYSACKEFLGISQVLLPKNLRGITFYLFGTQEALRKVFTIFNGIPCLKLEKPLFLKYDRTLARSDYLALKLYEVEILR